MPKSPAHEWKTGKRSGERRHGIVIGAVGFDSAIGCGYSLLLDKPIEKTR